MDSTRARAFVLGGALLLACRAEEPSGHDDGAGSGSSGGTSGAGSTSSGTTGGSSSAVTDGGSTAMGASSGDDGTTDATSTTAADGSTSASESSGSTGEPASACEQGCAVAFTCTAEWPSQEECVIACEANLAEAAAFSPLCATAWENVSECVGTLTCEQYLEWSMPTMFPYPCADADVGLRFECEGQ